MRGPYYVKRRERLLKKCDLDIGKANAKYRFIVDIMDDVIVIKRKKRAEAEHILSTASPPYPKFAGKIDDEDEKAGYSYLLGMQIHSFTEETLEKLKKSIEKAQVLKNELEGKTPNDLWEEDLDEFLIEDQIGFNEWVDRNEMNIKTPRTKLDISNKPKTKALISLKKT